MSEKQTMARRQSTVYKLVIYALFAAILAILSPLAIPMPGGVPMTLQTFALCLCGFFLGTRAVIPTLVYISLGIAGLPIFSNFEGGIGKLLGPTGGFIFGFVFVSLLCGIGIKLSEKLLKRSNKNNFISYAIDYLIPIAFGLIGLLICHLFGITGFSFVTEHTFVRSSQLVSVPFIPKDIASMILALAIAKTLKKRVPVIF